MPATTARSAPTTAEAVRTAVVRTGSAALATGSAALATGSAVLATGSAVLATDGAAPVTAVLHHLHSDGDLLVVVPDDCAAVALTWQRGAAGLHSVLELTDHSPLRLRNPVRSLIWLSGTAHAVAEPRRLAADIA
ncbi:prephenate dehydratase, partial [Rhodococcus rhodochrous]